ncbi:uncharacterized protein LOC130891627 [Diorhabda carinulata]|uniref:uncharacterized protein LOC130891627 n=1 Tax=Diorhabda carinulata TaxID=1163345 RepID=UPI0025A171F0|nr:uncharacterized protein LOC130891627 [Diorhabda carinulata]
MTDEKEKVKVSQRFFWLANTIFHQVVTVTVAFIAYVFVKNYDVSSRAFIHFFVTTFAYIPLMAEGFILFNESNTWSLQVKRSLKGWVHGALLTISLICVSIGIGVEVHYKNKSIHPVHFKSNHGKLGFISWVLCFCLALTGIITLYSSKLRIIIRPVTLKTIHLCLGLACFAIGVGSLILGLNYSHFRVTHNELLVTKTLISIITIWSSLGAIVSLFNNLKSMFT